MTELILGNALKRLDRVARGKLAIYCAVSLAQSLCSPVNDWTNIRLSVTQVRGTIVTLYGYLAQFCFRRRELNASSHVDQLAGCDLFM